MPAIKPHTTDTSTGSWDGPANEARLRSGESESYYHKAYAWQDPDGDPTTKAAYKFIHHEVDADGNPGAANIIACRTGIAVLNGARGGTTIPESDYQGVYNHLARHMRDAGEEPPELNRSINSKIERRTITMHELRVVNGEADKPRKIEGHAAVFNQWSETLGFWFPYKEKVMPGAFAETIEKDDIRALFNHDPNYVLGRNKSGTLELREDDQGLFVSITPPDTQWARDLMVSIERGDITQMSFGFEVISDRWGLEEGMDVRELHKVKLYDVSPVTFPAYPQTDVGVRSAKEVYEAHIAQKRADEIQKSKQNIEILRKKLELKQKSIV